MPPPPKRKENPNSNSHVGRGPKKAKKEEILANDPKRAQDLETATDSDPIVESDTTSQSGDDDGVSWPSEEEAEENDDEGVNIAAEAAGVSQSAEKAPNTKGTSSGMS